MKRVWENLEAKPSVSEREQLNRPFDGSRVFEVVERGSHCCALRRWKNHYLDNMHFAHCPSGAAVFGVKISSSNCCNSCCDLDE